MIDYLQVENDQQGQGIVVKSSNLTNQAIEICPTSNGDHQLFDSLVSPHNHLNELCIHDTIGGFEIEIKADTTLNMNKLDQRHTSLGNVVDVGGKT